MEVEVVRLMEASKAVLAYKTVYGFGEEKFPLWNHPTPSQWTTELFELRRALDALVDPPAPSSIGSDKR